MRVEQSFSVPEPPDRVFQFFDTEVERVVRSVPGVESFEDLGERMYRVRITERVGSMGATFNLQAQLDGKDSTWFEFSATGRSVKGAAGTMRAKNRLELAPAPGGGTELTVSSDLALGGMIGSLGYRVVASKAREILDQFARNVSSEMTRWSAGGPRDAD